MKGAVIILFATSLASVYAQGRQAAPPEPPAKETVAPGIPGVVAAGTKVVVVKDGYQSTEGAIVMPDGSVLFTEPGASRVHKIDKDGKITVFLEGTKRANGLAFDSKGRLFVADRSNNRVQIFDKDMNVVDSWTQFGRPSGIWILKDDTLIVSDSESNNRIGGPDDAPEGGGNAIRNPGWKNGIRIGSAKDGSLKYFIEGTRPEGLAADELGNVFGGLTAGCESSRSGGCLQKFVPVGKRRP